MSRLVHQDPSWATAIQHHCVNVINTAVAVLSRKEAAMKEAAMPSAMSPAMSPLECLTSSKTEVMRGLAALAAMGGASRPKVFYDGCKWGGGGVVVGGWWVIL